MRPCVRFFPRRGVPARRTGNGAFGRLFGENGRRGTEDYLKQDKMDIFFMPDKSEDEQDNENPPKTDK